MGVEVTRGRFLAGWGSPYTAPGLELTIIPHPVTRHATGWFGFVYSPARLSGVHLAAAPLWFLTLWPTLATYLLWRARRLPPSPNLCRTCGYDLRATPQRCPECGTSVTHCAAKARAPVSAE